MSFTSDTILVALELSNTLWLVGTRLPSVRKSHVYRIDAGDTIALLKLLGELQSRNQKTSKTGASIACCFEAGRDGFWIHRLLTDHNIPTHVVENAPAGPDYLLVHGNPPHTPTSSSP